MAFLPLVAPLSSGPSDLSRGRMLRCTRTARATSPAVLPTGTNTHQEYAS
ncbi:hypothetical protein [Streptomyces sp. NPDC051677]